MNALHGRQAAALPAGRRGGRARSGTLGPYLAAVCAMLCVSNYSASLLCIAGEPGRECFQVGARRHGRLQSDNAAGSGFWAGHAGAEMECAEHALC